MLKFINKKINHNFIMLKILLICTHDHFIPAFYYVTNISSYVKRNIFMLCNNKHFQCYVKTNISRYVKTNISSYIITDISSYIITNISSYVIT